MATSKEIWSELARVRAARGDKAGAARARKNASMCVKIKQLGYLLTPISGQRRLL
jgi:hypothetical protein